MFTSRPLICLMAVKVRLRTDQAHRQALLEATVGLIQSVGQCSYLMPAKEQAKLSKILMARVHRE